MNHNYYIPQHECVKNAIHAVWQVDHLTGYKHECIIPKGIVEVIFNFSNGLPIVAQVGARQCHLPRCFINGFNTAPIQLQLPEHQVFFGVIFQPLAIKKLFGNPAGEFCDMTVDVTHLHKTFDSLWHQLAAQANFNNRLKIFLSWLQENIIEWQPRDQLLNHFLYNGSHRVTVNQLAAALCYSPRHLSRKVFEAAGMNAEEILLYKKYLHAVHLIHNTNQPLTAIAYESGFCDQPHLIRSFKTYTQITPGQYKRDKSFNKGHLYKDVR